MTRTYFWNVGHQAVSNATLKELLLKNKKSPIRIFKKKEILQSHIPHAQTLIAIYYALIFGQILENINIKG